MKQMLNEKNSLIQFLLNWKERMSLDTVMSYLIMNRTRLPLKSQLKPNMID